MKECEDCKRLKYQIHELERQIGELNVQIAKLTRANKSANAFIYQTPSLYPRFPGFDQLRP